MADATSSSLAPLQSASTGEQTRWSPLHGATFPSGLSQEVAFHMMFIRALLRNLKGYLFQFVLLSSEFIKETVLKTAESPKVRFYKPWLVEIQEQDSFGTLPKVNFHFFKARSIRANAYFCG